MMTNREDLALVAEANNWVLQVATQAADTWWRVNPDDERKRECVTVDYSGRSALVPQRVRGVTWSPSMSGTTVRSYRGRGCGRWALEALRGRGSVVTEAEVTHQ